MEKEELIQRAKLALQAKRYDDMVGAMKLAAETDVELTKDERDLFYLAYKNVFDTKKGLWLAISGLEQMALGSPNESKATGYRKKVGNDLKKICQEVFGLLNGHLLPKAESNPLNKAYYLKLKGDYYRYLAEVANDGREKATAVEESQNAYQEALDISKEKMRPIHPLRLAIASNFSVLYFDIMRIPDKAFQLAQQTFNDAMMELSNLDADLHKNSVIIMNSLKHNLVLWRSGAVTEGVNPSQRGGSDTNVCDFSFLKYMVD